MPQEVSRRLAMAMMLSPLAVTAAEAKMPWSRVKPATVVVIPSLHKRHQTNPNYGYDRLYRIVRAFRPDRVGVEIRPEDMAAAPGYLTDWYPEEMVTLKNEYGDRAFGFDWFGDDVAGQAVPVDWRTTGAIKVLERESSDATELKADERQAYAAKLAALQSQQETLLSKATPRSLADGRYDALCRDYYDTLRAYLAGTRFEAMSGFYTARDAHLAANIGAFVKAHPGERIAVVTGADHHGPITRYLKDGLAGKVVLTKVSKA